MSEQLLKKKILIFIDWFLPGYKAGGPVRSMANMVDYLKEEYDFFVYTSNKDYDGEILDVQNDQWLVFNEGSAKVYYSSKPGLAEVKNIIKDISPDTIYLNSVFSLKYTIYPLFINTFLSNIRIPKVVFAPRGMFQKGALRLKGGKKRLFLMLVKPLLFKARNIIWHATDKQEKEDVKDEVGKSAPVKEVSNIPTTQVIDYGIQLPEDEIRFVTISLVAEKKNHIFFLKLLQTLKLPEGRRIVYDIYGPVKDYAYWQRCQELITEMPNGVTVSYKGSVIPTMVNKTLQAYQFFVLPTLGENFGHAIFEALVNGVPVLISELTPWRRLANMKGGWDLKLEMRGEKKELSSERGDVSGEKIEWRTKLNDIIAMTPEEHQHWQEGAKAVARTYIAEQDYRRSYKELL
ncbi:glycosyltransferase [Carboxylicivirga linearis]|uniref:Glycosyltransferase n=1 Tax=Carboxylicivirga linearis TaxID=1628157 RepID=A0ABS5JUK4_9BACT|nr:glycosyltransferase [Carboxylicivirga linearis]MBS2098532.1 glycosyltransferase [Carboxylicivirga linearis]